AHINENVNELKEKSKTTINEINEKSHKILKLRQNNEIVSKFLNEKKNEKRNIDEFLNEEELEDIRYNKKKKKKKSNSQESASQHSECDSGSEFEKEEIDLEK